MSKFAAPRDVHRRSSGTRHTSAVSHFRTARARVNYVYAVRARPIKFAKPKRVAESKIVIVHSLTREGAACSIHAAPTSLRSRE